MGSVDDEIALLAEDIRRWAGSDARIHDALEQLLKIYKAEVDALVFEAAELEGLLIRETVRATTERETQRINTAEHNRTVRWVGRDYR